MSLGNPERPVGGLAVRPPTGVELRPIGRSDLADAVRLARELHGLAPLSDSEPLRGRLEALLDSADVSPFLAVEDEVAVGLGILQFRRRLNFPTFEGWISDLYVEEPQRGRGLGRALLDALIAEWRLRGAHRLQAKVPNGAPAAARLYAAAGLHDWMLDFRLSPLTVKSGPMANVEIRPTGIGDFEAVTRLISQFGVGRTPAAERMAAVQRAFAAHLDDVVAGRGYSSVAVVDGSVAGVCAVEWQRPFWTDETQAWLPDLIVDEGHRQRGIGRALLVDVLRQAAAMGATRISLESGEQREAAHRLYRSMGFEEVGHTWLLQREIP